MNPTGLLHLFKHFRTSNQFEESKFHTVILRNTLKKYNRFRFDSFHQNSINVYENWNDTDTTGHGETMFAIGSN